MSDYRDMRRATRDAIAEERARADQEIARLRAENEQKIKQLKKEQDEELARYGRELAELEKRQIIAVSDAEARINERLKEQEKALQERMEKTRRDAFEKIRAQKREFEEQLRIMYAEIDRRINELMEKLQEMAEDEQELAKEQTEEAIDLFNELCENPDACTFQEDTIRTILKPLIKACQDAFNAGEYAVATGKALLAGVECRQTEISARRERADWDERYQAVRDTLEEILELLAGMADETTVVQALGESRKGSLKSWDDKDYVLIAESIEEMRKVLESIPAGGHASLTTLESQLHSVLNDHVIETVSDRLVFQITAFLMAMKMLIGVCIAEREDWTVQEETLIEEKEYVGASFTNDVDETLKVRVNVDPDSLGMGLIRLELRLALDGTRRDEELRHTMDGIAADLKQTFQNSEYGALQCVEEFEYNNGEGLSAKEMDFKPVAGSRRGQIIRQSKVSEDPSGEGIKPGESVQTGKEMKGEAT
ncbi:MAG: hypothetical protein IJK38_13965 [Oscillospiraceae bacterium]|nr:hypothetical protein [Oscillospiraceae bacterium]